MAIVKQGMWLNCELIKFVCGMVRYQTAGLRYLLPNSRCHCRLHHFPTWRVGVALTRMNVALQVEQQFSHKFTVTVVRAESVTKGALGDLCESLCILILHAAGRAPCIHLPWPEMYWCRRNEKFLSDPATCVGSGHPRPVCGTVHPHSSGEQKKDQAHRQRHQSGVERDLHLHLRPQPTECLGGWTKPIAVINIKSSGTMAHC